MKPRISAVLGVSAVLLVSCGGDEGSVSTRTKNAALTPPTSTLAAPTSAAGTVVAETTTPSTVAPVVTAAATTVLVAPTTVAPTAPPLQTTIAPTTAPPVVSTTSPVVSIAQAPGSTTRQFTLTPNTIAPRPRTCNIVQKKGLKSPRPRPNAIEDSYIILRTTLGCPAFILSVETWHEGPSGRLDEIKTLVDMTNGRTSFRGQSSVDIKRVNDFNENDALYQRDNDKVAAANGSFFNFLYNVVLWDKANKDQCLVNAQESNRYGFQILSQQDCRTTDTSKVTSVFGYEVPNPGYNYLSEVTVRSCRNWSITLPADRDKCRTATLVVRIVFSDGYAIENIRIPLQ